MVSYLSIAAMIFTLVISLITPIICIIYLQKNGGLNLKALITGIAIFVVFSQVLEKIMHIYFLYMNNSTAALLKNTIPYCIYGGIAAGLFEEIGRYFGFSFILKGRHSRIDGLSYGIGHGGIEALLIGSFGSINNLIYSYLINNGTIDQYLKQSLSASSINQLKSSLINTNSFLFAVSGFERLMAFVFQIALSLLVLYGIKNRKKIFLFYAILLHAAVDIVSALLGSVNTWLAELVILIVAIGSVYWIIKSKNFFDKPKNNDEIQTTLQN